MAAVPALSRREQREREEIREERKRSCAASSRQSPSLSVMKLAVTATTVRAVVVAEGSQRRCRPWVRQMRESVGRERGCSRSAAAARRMAAPADLPAAIYAYCGIAGAPRRRHCHQKPPLRPKSVCHRYWLSGYAVVFIAAVTVTARMPWNFCCLAPIFSLLHANLPWFHLSVCSGFNSILVSVSS
ncbi:uncharacterized protein LOC110268468 [Arachis ipaensis]|uniref:uncharacterized protein LOC110268468 n=1 Tax=Arachis ipaensis TaxID=130454 RepID=UPI000A2B0CFB|nr:uncharacterized protein LOC110268468 [Arachis ipaensis]